MAGSTCSIPPTRAAVSSCDYKLGVARAKQLLGPWERNPANPILGGNSRWQCPGHGSVVETPDGRDFLLYHAYRTVGFQFIGRQGLLDAIAWTADGWPTINNGQGPSEKAAGAARPDAVEGEPADVVDDFLGTAPAHRLAVALEPAAGRSVRRASRSCFAPSGRRCRPAQSTRLSHGRRAFATTRRPRASRKSAGERAWPVSPRTVTRANALGASLDVGSSWSSGSREERAAIDRRQCRWTVKTWVDLRMVVTGAERYSFQFSVDGADWQKARRRRRWRLPSSVGSCGASSARRRWSKGCGGTIRFVRIATRTLALFRLE